MSSIITNKEFSESSVFTNICKKANIKATKRQASKFKMKKGFTYKVFHQKLKNIHLPKEARLMEN